jgi:hypothetical protein
MNKNDNFKLVKESKFEELSYDDVNSIINYASGHVSKEDLEGNIYISKRLSRVLQINGFRSIEEPRAFREINDKIFVRYEKDSALEGWYGFCLTYYHKSFFRTFVSIKRVNGLDGHKDLYVFSRLNGGYIVFTTHFFERYYQRVIDQTARIFNSEKIDKAIKSFIKMLVNQMHSNSLFSKQSDLDIRVMVPFDNGFGLGYGIEEQDILLMTFVDNGSAKSGQKKDIEEIMKNISEFDKDFGVDFKPYRKAYRNK